MREPRESKAAAERGVYVLLFRLLRRTRAVVGETNRSTLWFAPGLYAYVGSGKGTGTTSVTGRVLRHVNLSDLKKKRRWNIDELSGSPGYRPLGAIIFPNPRRKECRLVRPLARAVPIEVAAKGFGNNDDKRRPKHLRCKTHTWRVLGKVRPPELAAAMGGEWRPMRDWRRLAAAMS